MDRPSRTALLLVFLGAVVAFAPVAAEERTPSRSHFLDSSGAAAYHRLGVRGRGVKVGILDTGFRGYRGQLNRALPDQFATRCFRGDGLFEGRDSPHGVLCAEVVHALAPDADLVGATWEPDRADQFLDAVRWARQQGVRILSCSVIMPTWSDGEGGGPVHAALGRLLGDGAGKGDLLLFASAGNTAERHGGGPYRPNADGWHLWPGGGVDNAVRPWGDDPVSVELCWPEGSAYELTVWDAATGDEVGRTRGTASAVVRFLPEAKRAYRARLRRVAGRGETFHLVALGANLDDADRRGSVGFPGDGAAVVAVGAVDADGRRLPYSSCGPNSPRPKPDLVAEVPFPSAWRSRPFSGTSAAAPQAAALAALLWSRHPDWTARQVRQAMAAAARDLGAPGHDGETGYGRATLPP